MNAWTCAPSRPHCATVQTVQPTRSKLFWLLAFGFWLLAFGFWLLAFGFWLLAFGFWLLAFGKVTLTQDTVEVETVTQFFSLKIVGVVSRPSPEAGGERLQTEWIVWVGDELKDGNYKAYRTLIVRPPSNSRGGRYTGTLYPKQ